MGKSLSIHPLTIIVVILAAGDLGGFTLILIAVPLYAVLKTIMSNVFKYRQRIIDKANSDVKDQIDINLKRFVVNLNLQCIQVHFFKQKLGAVHTK